jgi:hypothetical protein
MDSLKSRVSKIALRKNNAKILTKIMVFLVCLASNLMHTFTKPP